MVGRWAVEYLISYRARVGSTMVRAGACSARLIRLRTAMAVWPSLKTIAFKFSFSFCKCPFIDLCGSIITGLLSISWWTLLYCNDWLVNALRLSIEQTLPGMVLLSSSIPFQIRQWITLIDFARLMETMVLSWPWDWSLVCSVVALWILQSNIFYANIMTTAAPVHWLACRHTLIQQCNAICIYWVASMRPISPVLPLIQ